MQGKVEELQQHVGELEEDARLRFGADHGYREDDIGAASSTHRLDRLRSDVTHKPVGNVTVGLEYFTGEREQFDGTTTDADRVQASVQVSF